MDNFSGFPEHEKEIYAVSSNSPSENERCTNKINLPKGNHEPWIKCRYIAVLMGFMTDFFLYSLRINMGVSIVAMVNNSALSNVEEAKSESCLSLKINTSEEDYNFTFDHDKIDGEFDWTPETQGYVLGCSSLLYAIGTAPAGKLTALFGCKKVLFWGLFLSSLCTVISPFAAWCHVYLLIFIQSARGLFQASVVPAQATLIANWCPKSERGFLYTITYSGSCWGAVLGSYISGLLCELSLLGGWPFSFFVSGGAGLIASIFLGYYLYDNPSIHPRISQAELKYILENQENPLTQRRPKAPWFSILTSVPVYAMVFAYFGQMWASSQFLNVFPTFLGTILHYPIKKNGLFSALPFLLQFVTSISGSALSSWLESKNYMTVNVARKFWTFVACLGYSVCLLGVYFAGCNSLLSVVLGIASLAFTGFAYAGCWLTSADMSPTFAASVNSVTCVAFLSNFLLPVVVGYLTTGMQTLEQWNKVFLISIAVVLSSGVVFAVFGSAEVQPWNNVAEDRTNKKDQITRF